MTADKNLLIERCKEFYKTRGFRKKNCSWFNDTGLLIMCFNIQSSQWDPTDYYINVGIVLKGIDTKPQIALGTWHFMQRIDCTDRSCDEIINESYSWLIRHGNMDYLKKLCEANYHDRLPVMVLVDACNFLLAL